MRRLAIRYKTPRSIKARISSTRHAVVRGPSLTGLGNRPLLMPAHHDERPTEIGPVGARMEERRRKPAIESCAVSALVTATTSTLDLDTEGPSSSGDEPAPQSTFDSH